MEGERYLSRIDGTLLFDISRFLHRYIDDIFMTTNQTIDEITVELQKANSKDININISTSIGTSVHFLDLTVTNENGQLRTAIYHKPTTEPYILPYTSDHPRHIHRNIPYAALLRGARICSNVYDFNSECTRIDMSLLLNNYPPNFITKQFNRFFHLNNAQSLLTQLDVDTYRKLHHFSLHQPTRREKKLNQMMQNPIEDPLVLQPKVWNKEVMFPRYLFDSSLTCNLSTKFYTWWNAYYAFSGSPLAQVKVYTGQKHKLDVGPVLRSQETTSRHANEERDRMIHNIPFLL